MRRVVCIALAVGLSAAGSLVVPGVVLGSAGTLGTVLVASSDPTTQPGVVRASLLDPVTGAMRVILQSKTLCCTGAWSPDGKWLALAKFNGVMLLGGDGRNPRLLPLLRAPPGNTTGAVPSFGWAPNSRSLAINEAAGHQLVIRGLDGHIRVIRRTGKTTVMGSVTWSPDGRWISYDRDNLGGGNGVGCCSSSLHLIHPDGSGDHPVAMVHEAIHDVPSPAFWAPSGHRFAFTTEGRDARDPTLALVNADSGTITPLPLANVSVVAWSSDATEFAIWQGFPPGQPSALSWIDASGQSRPLTTMLPPYPVAAWSAEETSLVIVGAQTGSQDGVFTIGAVDLELVDLAGGPPRVLTQLPSGSSVQLLAIRPAG
jgi:hypothetical protein